MALVITVALLKGGVGKTTTAIALAEAASLGAPTILIDADPMGSAWRWSRLAAESGHPLRSSVIPVAPADLPRRIAATSRGAAVIVIDGMPQGTKRDRDGVFSVADLAVMPCPPEFAALDRVPATLAEAAEQGTRALAVLTMVRAGLADRDAALAALSGWHVPVARTELPLRAEVQRCYGQPVTGTLARFGIDLMTELIEGNGNG